MSTFPYLAHTVRHSPRLEKTVIIRRPPVPRPVVAPREDPVLAYLVAMTEVVPLPLFFAIGMLVGLTGGTLFFKLVA